MNKAQKIFAKVNVLSCEPKFEKGTTRQMSDRDGNPLWTVDVEEKSFNEKHKREVMEINTYKTLEELPNGENIVELKVTNIGEGSGTFIGVKTFYTILRSVEKKASLSDIFSFSNGGIPHSSKAVHKKPVATMNN